MGRWREGEGWALGDGGRVRGRMGRWREGEGEGDREMEGG